MSQLRLCVLAAMMFPLAMVQAAPITFFGEDLNGNPLNRIAVPNANAARTSFFSAVKTAATDTFEEFSGGDSLPLSLTFSGTTAATLNGSAGFIESLSTGTDGFGRFPISGNNLLVSNAAILTLSFARPITSFGFYGVDVGAFGAQLTASFQGIQTVSEVVPHSLGTGRGSPQNGSVLFFGYSNPTNPFTVIQLFDSSATSTFGYDDFTVGMPAATAAPEPASLTLIGFGLVALLLGRKQFSA